jgi:hypothetical protein
MEMSRPCEFFAVARPGFSPSAQVGLPPNRLNAYYTFIHPYFPILPPPVLPLTIDRPAIYSLTTARGPLPYIPTSPLSLAISAILALIPLPQDTNPSSAESIAFRRSLAQRFAQAALESVETDSEFLGFTVGEKLPIHRIPFHPRTPVELECIHALLILSNYEHAQRGNLLKMTARAGQALITAKNMSLHCLGPDIDEFSEAKRRAWWMTVSAQELLVMRETKLIVFLCSPLCCCSS